MGSSEIIYLDNAATTRVLPNICAAMLPFFLQEYGNPGSPHRFGQNAKKAVRKAREQVAGFMNVPPEQIVFTSSGSESNTLAITGLSDYLKSIGKRHIVTSQAEHKSVLNACEEMEIRGFDVTYLPVDGTAAVTVEQISEVLRGDTGLVALMAANNELGTLNPVKEVADICHERGILFHCDATQSALGYGVDASLFDSCTISGHKIHAPKGVAAVYLKHRDLYSPVVFGGSQEGHLRAGTENVPEIVALGEAAKYLTKHNENILERTTNLAERFSVKLTAAMREAGFDDTGIYRTRPYTKLVSVRIPHVDAAALVLSLGERGVMVSAGAACNSEEVLPSHVLIASGMSLERASEVVRVSFSDENTEEEIDRAVRIFADTATLLKNLNQKGT